MVSIIACGMLFSIFFVGVYINPIMGVFLVNLIGNIFIHLKLSKWIENKEFQGAFSERKLKVVKGIKLIILTLLYMNLIPTSIKVASSIHPVIKNLLF